MISLLQRDSWDFLQKSQYILCSFRSITFLFVLICYVNVNLLSKYIPRYFPLFTLGRNRSYRLTVGTFLVVNVICTDFVSLAFMRHLSDHVWISESFLWRILGAISESWQAANIAVSSAYVATVTSLLIDRSAVDIVYRTGPSTLPCGTPDLMDAILICGIHVARKIVFYTSTI